MRSSLSFLVAAGSSLFLAGCLLDAGAFANDGGGTTTSSTTQGGGGSGGGSTSTTTTSSGGTTTSDGGTTTTTTPTPECAVPSDCPSAMECQSVDCVSGACVVGSLPVDTPVSNDDMHDCKQKVCDGQGHVKEAPAMETPIQDSDPCHTLSCDNGQIAQMNVSDMTLCGPQPASICQAMACFGGVCSPAFYEDGPYQIGVCGEITCAQGQASPLSFNYKYCPDGNPNNCITPKCVDTGGGVSACMGTQYAPQNQMCTKQGGGGGFCDSFGNCD